MQSREGMKHSAFHARKEEKGNECNNNNKRSINDGGLHFF